MEDVPEISRKLLLKADAKYDFFKLKPEMEEDLIIIYKKMELYIKKFAQVGFTKTGDKFDFKYSKLTFLLMQLIKEVEVLEYLKGVDKKQLVLNVLVLIIERELPIPGIAKMALVQVVELLVPVMIDEMVALTKTMKHSSTFKKIRRKFLRVITCGAYKKR